MSAWPCSRESVGAEPIDPSTDRVVRGRRSHPGRTRVDDVAQYAVARAVQTDAEGADLIGSIAAQVQQPVGIERRRVARVQDVLFQP